MTEPIKKALIAINILITLSFISSSANARLRLPGPQQALVLSLGIPSLALAWQQELSTGQAWGALTYQLDSQVAGLNLGHQWTLLHSGDFALNSYAELGPLLGLDFSPSLGAHLGSGVSASYQLKDWCLLLGPYADAAWSVNAMAAVDHRLDLAAALALGWRALPVAVWWRGEAGYTLGGQGAGALKAGLSLVFQVSL